MKKEMGETSEKTDGELVDEILKENDKLEDPKLEANE